MATEVVGRAVLKDYPLRVWAQSQQHTDEVLREFTLMLEGQRSGQTDLDVPKSLIDLADRFTAQFGPLIEQLQASRTQALLDGHDRIDSEVPLVKDIPQVLAGARQVLEAVDAYCRSGELLTLERPESARRLFDWTCDELVKQYEGGEPSPWPGPF